MKTTYIALKTDWNSCKIKAFRTLNFTVDNDNNYI